MQLALLSQLRGILLERAEIPRFGLGGRGSSSLFLALNIGRKIGCGRCAENLSPLWGCLLLSSVMSGALLMGAAIALGPY